MAENSFKDWINGRLISKRSQKKIKQLEFTPSIFIKQSKNNNYLFLSDVAGLGDAIMFRGVLKPFVDSGINITLITKKYHLDAYKDLGISNILLWEDIETIKDLEYKKIFAQHLNARSYEYLKSIASEEKYIINSTKKIDNIITINSDKHPKNIWEVYDNFLNNFKYKYSFVDFEKKNIKSIFDRNKLIENEYISIHIGSGSLCKNWGMDNFFKVSKELDSLKIKHIFIAGPFEKNILEKYKLNNVVSDLDFLSLVEVIRNSKIVICHGTSILHLSVTVNTPTISINNTNDYNFWHPYKDMLGYRNKHIALTSKSSTNCNKYRRLVDFGLGLNKDGCPILKNEVGIEEVIKQIKKGLINEN